MSRILIALPLAAALAASGCNTTGATSVEQTILDITLASCHYVPTLTTLASILAAGNPALATAAEVAKAICDAVAPPASIRHAGALLAPEVAGVVIEGHFVR